MSAITARNLIVHGWMIFAHPLFLDQLAQLTKQVEAAKQKDSAGFYKKNAAKRLSAIFKLAFDVIPQDPTRSEYRQGNTLGDQHKHWRRAKFFQQYRLFFRYHVASKVIVLAWVNDADTKRAYESGDDAYRTFRKMLINGNPPDAWAQLLGLTQNRPSGVMTPSRTSVLSSSSCLAGTILRKSYGRVCGFE